MKKALERTVLCTLCFIYLCACGRVDPTWQEQYDLGMRYLSEGNYEEAIIAFTAAIEVDSRQAPAYVGRGDAYMLSGETEENLAAARADYEKALELGETSAEAYLRLADIFIREGNYEKAMEVLQTGLEKISEDEAISSKISEIENQLDSRDWALKSPIGVDELTIGGIPFYQTNIYQAKERYSADPFSEIYEDTEGILSYQPLSSGLRFFQYPDREALTVVECFLGSQCEFRHVVVGESLHSTLEKLGFTEFGIRYIEKSALDKTGGLFGNQVAATEWEKTKSRVSNYEEDIPEVYWDYYTETESLTIELSWFVSNEQIKLCLDFRDETLFTIRMTAF